jgi:gas vesicle protein
MSTGKVILGTTAGLAVGAILGILFAPDKGSVTRQQIIDTGNDCAADLKSKYNEFADTLKEKLQSVKQNAQDITENGKSKFGEIKSDVKKDINDITSSY